MSEANRGKPIERTIMANAIIHVIEAIVETETSAPKSKLTKPLSSKAKSNAIIPESPPRIMASLRKIREMSFLRAPHRSKNANLFDTLNHRGIDDDSVRDRGNHQRNRAEGG